MIASTNLFFISYSMTKLKKLLEFFEQHKHLEKFDKKKGKWVLVELDPKDPDIFQLLETMSAELDIMVRIEEIQLGINFDKEKLD